MEPFVNDNLDLLIPVDDYKRLVPTAQRRAWEESADMDKLGDDLLADRESDDEDGDESQDEQDDEDQQNGHDEQDEQDGQDERDEQEEE